MRAFGRRVAGFLVAGVLVLVGMSGCGADPETGLPAPTSAKDVYERFQQSPNLNNNHMDVSIDISMKVANFETPFTLNVSLDDAGNEKHGTFDTAMLGSSTSSELYVTKDGNSFVQYNGQKIDGDTYWTKKKVDEAISASTLIDAEDIEGGEFTATEDGYNVRLSGDKILVLLDRMTGSSVSITNVLGSGSQKNLKDAFEHAKVQYVFDKDCLLKSVSFENDYLQDMGSIDNVQVQAACSVKMHAEIRDYGKMVANKLAVPDAVKKAATESTSTGEEESYYSEPASSGSSTSQAETSSSSTETNSSSATTSSGDGASYDTTDTSAATGSSDYDASYDASAADTESAATSYDTSTDTGGADASYDATTGTGGTDAYDTQSVS